MKRQGAWMLWAGLFVVAGLWGCAEKPVPKENGIEASVDQPEPAADDPHGRVANVHRGPEEPLTLVEGLQLDGLGFDGFEKKSPDHPLLGVELIEINVSDAAPEGFKGVASPQELQVDGVHGAKMGVEDILTTLPDAGVPH